jgi:ribonuclease HII
MIFFELSKYSTIENSKMTTNPYLPQRRLICKIKPGSALAERLETLPIDQPQIGVDEAGRGSFWGPLIAAAVILPDIETLAADHPLRENAWLIKDSKKLTEKRRDKIYNIIIENAIAIGVGRVEAAEIDSHNAFWGNSLAFRRAIDKCIGQFDESRPYSVMLDGNLPLPDCRERETVANVENGDALYLPVAAASIVAKVTHDRIIEDWCMAHPREAAIYALASSKGYGTAAHRAAIQRHGPLADHRKSYLKKTAPQHAQRGLEIVDEII